jgi:hypothetical protein
VVWSGLLGKSGSSLKDRVGKLINITGWAILLVLGGRGKADINYKYLLKEDKE